MIKKIIFTAIILLCSTNVWATYQLDHRTMMPRKSLIKHGLDRLNKEVEKVLNKYEYDQEGRPKDIFIDVPDAPFLIDWNRMA